jgi:hypothetical protein
MIRQAHTYLVGALSGVVVIGIAIAAFVVLVSAQVFHDLPIPALSSQDQKTAVSSAKAVSAPDHGAFATTGGATPTAAQPRHATAKGTGQTGAATHRRAAHHQAGAAVPTQDATAPAQVVETAPSTSGTETGSSSGSGHSSSHSSHPSSNSPSSSSNPSPGSNAGGGSGGSSGSGAPPTTSTGTSGTGTGGTSGSGGGSTGGEGGGSTSPGTPVTTAKPSEEITEGVDKTVEGVDEALGGTLGETGATHVTEEVVQGVAGPESVVGKTVDGVNETVKGLLGGGEH